MLVSCDRVLWVIEVRVTGLHSAYCTFLACGKEMVAPGVSPIVGAEQLHIGGTRLLVLDLRFSSHRKIRGAIGGNDPAIRVVPEGLRRSEHRCGKAVARV